MRFVAAFILGLVLAACNGGGSAKGSDDGNNGLSNPTTGSNTAGDTDGGDTGSDVEEPPKPECTTHDDCPDGICDCRSACVPEGVVGLPECIENINCGSGFYCDVCAGVCRQFKVLCESCQNHDECEDGACIDFAVGGRFCLRDCVADPGCPQPGFICQEISGITYKQCTPKSGNCKEPTLCQSDMDCDFGDICTQGECKLGCNEDGACPENTVCSAFRCVAKCSNENPCPDGQICTEDGHCKIEGGCLEPKECLNAGTYCDLNDNMCKPGCLQDFDCKSSGKICENMDCVDKGCTANYVCAFEQICNQDSGLCEKAKGPHCEANCDPQSESSCGGAPNKCLGLQDKDGNDKGNFCFVACGPDPKNKCPQGYQCTPIQDQDGNVTAELCTRDCTVNPI